MSHLIGYGAYNLCFDRDLGRTSPGGPDFFQFMRNGGWPINLVKVICFRKATLEGLPAGDPRTIPLYNASRQINQAFTANVAALVKRARETDFTVQLCIFSYHSVARNETPESVPAVLDPAQWGNPCARVSNFFSVANRAIVDEQVKLVQALVNQLRFTGNLDSHVLWEVANELRCDVCTTLDRNRSVNCGIVPWLNRMATAIRDAAGPIASNIITSTGIHLDSLALQPGGANERITFDTHRPADGCSALPFTANTFDLHSGQWDATGDYEKALSTDIKFRFLSYGYPRPAFIINDDGVPAAQRTAANVQKWATAAFRNGYGYASKQEYPPLGYDIEALKALKNANAAVP